MQYPGTHAWREYFGWNPRYPWAMGMLQSGFPFMTSSITPNTKLSGDLSFGWPPFWILDQLLARILVLLRWAISSLQTYSAKDHGDHNNGFSTSTSHEFWRSRGRSKLSSSTQRHEPPHQFPRSLPGTLGCSLQLASRRIALRRVSWRFEFTRTSGCICMMDQFRANFPR